VQPGHSETAAAAAAAAAAAGGDTPREGEAGVSRSVPQHHADKLMGWAEGNLPQVRSVHDVS
jgi:hypothetical protein